MDSEGVTGRGSEVAGSSCQFPMRMCDRKLKIVLKFRKKGRRRQTEFPKLRANPRGKSLAKMVRMVKKGKQGRGDSLHKFWFTGEIQCICNMSWTVNVLKLFIRILVHHFSEASVIFWVN